MAPMKKKAGKGGGKKKEMITVEVKKEIIGRHERGVRVADLARFYRKATSTICCILKKKEEIKGLDAAKGVTRVSKQRPRVLEDVEKLLLVWISQKQLAGAPVSENFICAKARALYADLASKLPGTSAESEDGFKASRGWFDNFKRRSGIQSVARPGDTSGSDAGAAEGFAPRFQKLLVSECYLPQQFFNCDEMGLFWKKVPRRTYVTAGENEMVSLGKAMGLETDEEGVQEPVEEHGRDLTTDELMDLYLEQQREVMEEISSKEQEEEEENKAEESLTSNEIREMCKMWETVQNFVEKHHPNKVVAVRAMNLFNDSAMSHFCEILKRRQTRVSLDRFLVKVAGKENYSSEPTDSSDSLSDRHPPTQ